MFSRTFRTVLPVSRLISTSRCYSLASYAKDIPTVELTYDKHPASKQMSNEPIIFLHGLFGSKVNNRSVSKVLAKDLARDVYCLDLRNHGNSPHIARHDYPALAADVEAFIEEHDLGPSILIGHSMGAKTSMAVSLRRPDLVAALIPVDNAPVDAQLSSSFPVYARAMKKIESSNLKHSRDAYAIMNEVETNLTIQQFLLSNLKKSPGEGYKFRIPVDILSKALDFMADFPFTPEESRFNGPTMFIRGTDSHYVSDEAYSAMGQFFPRFTVRDIKAGHWVISEKPDEFVDLVKEFISREVDE